MVSPKSTKPLVQSQAQQTSATITAIATEQPRKISKSIGQKKRKSVSKSKVVDLVQKPVNSTGVKAKTLELPSGHENRLETISIKSSVLPRSAPETVRENSSNSFKEEERAGTLPRAKSSKKTKKDAKSSVDVLKKREQNCEKCGFVKIDYVVDRCTSVADILQTRSASEQLDLRHDKRFSVLSEKNKDKSNDDELIKPVISSETVQLDGKTVAEATQTGNSSHSGSETCEREVQASTDERRYSKLNEIKTQRRLGKRTEPDDQQYSSQEKMFKQYDFQNDKPKPRYYETESQVPKCEPCGRFNDEKCNFDCSARTFSERQCASCGRPNDREMSAPMVSFKSSRMFDAAALPYQRTAKSLDIEGYGRPKFGQFGSPEKNRYEPMEDFQKEFIAQPNERDMRMNYSHFEEEQQVQYQPMERQNEKLPQAKRISRSPARPKCQKETCTHNCRRCSRRNTEPKPTYQGLPIATQKTRSKSKSPHSERPRYQPRSVFSVDDDRSAEYMAMHQYRQGVNDEINRSNAARNFPLNNTLRGLSTLPPQKFDRCCQSTQTPLSANEDPSQSQRRISSSVQNTTRPTQTFPRSDSVDSINTNIKKRPGGDIPDRATMPDGPIINGTYDPTRTANKTNNCHPPKDCQCCCCYRRRLEGETLVSEVTAIRRPSLDEEVERRRSMPLEERLSQIENHAAVLAITSRLRLGSSDLDSECCQH